MKFLNRAIQLAILLLAGFTLCSAASAPTHSKEELQGWSQQVLTSALDELSRVLDYRFAGDITLQVYTPQEFEEEIGSAAELNALFHDGRIAVVARKTPRLYHLRRTIRHEAVHAAIAQLSGVDCPAWLEEGLAQLFEGHPPIRLTTALRTHAVSGEKIRLAELENSFAILPQEKRAVAYAFSRFAVRSLVNTYGYNSVRKYLLLRRLSVSPAQTFRDSFSITSEQFEEKLQRQLRRWVASGNSLS